LHNQFDHTVLTVLPGSIMNTNKSKRSSDDLFDLFVFMMLPRFYWPVGT